MGHSTLPWSVSGPGPNGHADGLLATMRGAEVEAENAMLREQIGQLHLILESATEHAVITMDIEGCVTSWNAGARRIVGYEETEILGCSGEILFIPEERASGRFTIELCQAIETGRATNERWHLRKDGMRFWASGTMTPLLDSAGQPQGFLNVMQDRTQECAEAERRALLMSEMSHRIKNTFSTVQAVSSQTGRHTRTVAEFQGAFAGRLMVMARSHETLLRAHWKDAPLREVIEDALDVFGAEPRRIALDGPSVLLAAKLTTIVSLAFHELATNATKYGALSVPNGQVDIAWTISSVRNGAHRVNILWREHGGPPVQPPKRRGFGSRLLEQGMQSEGTVQLDFQPAGLECRICLPLGTSLPYPI